MERKLRVRPHILVAGAMALLLIFGSSCTSGSPPGSARSSTSPSAQVGDQRSPRVTARQPLLVRPLIWLAEDHRRVGTHMDGVRCPMYPSCAAYGLRAMRQEGFYGLLLVLDRLFFRELGDLGAKYLIAPRRFSEARRYYDPLSDALTTERPSLLREPDFGR